MRVIWKKAFILLSVCFAIVSACFMIAMFTNITAKADSDTFEMVNGASVKFADSNSGIRFRVKMGKDIRDNIVNNDSVTLTFIITSKELFDAQNDGEYMDIVKKQTITVDENKIYEDSGYYYANGCLTQVRESNRDVRLVAIAAIYNGSAYSYAFIDSVGATGSMYDTLNQALLATSRDYIPLIVKNSNTFSSWYGTEDYPVYINSTADYNKLKDKFATANVETLQNLKYNVLAEANQGTIQNVTFNSNVTTTYKVTFDPDNGDAVINKIIKSGDAIVAPSDPVKSQDNTYTYSFTSWGDVPATCSASATYTAVYTPSYRNYTVAFKSHDGTTTLSTKNDYHYGDSFVKPVDGTSYTVSGNSFSVVGWQNLPDTVEGDAVYNAIGEMTAPDGKISGSFATVDLDVDAVATENKPITLAGKHAYGGITVLDGERVLQRNQEEGASDILSEAASLSLDTVSGIDDYVTEMHLPFYVDSLTGTLDMKLRLYCSTHPAVGVTYKNAAGSMIAIGDVTEGNWYTAIYDLSDIKSAWGQHYVLTPVAADSETTANLYYRKPYFTIAAGKSSGDVTDMIEAFDAGTFCADNTIHATDSSKVLDVSAIPALVADNTVHANNTAYLSSAQADNTLHANTPDSGYLAESDGVYTLTKVAGQSCAGSAGPNSFYIDNTIAATSLTFDIKFGDGKYLFPVNAGGEALFKPLSDYVTITNKTTGAPLALDSGADKDGYTGYLTYGDAWYTVTMDVTGINRIWVGLWDTGNSGTAQITGIAFSGGDEADYCLTKVAGVYCTPTGDAGFKFVNNGFNTVTFEMKPVACRYLLIFNDVGMFALKPFNSYVTMTNQTTGVNLAFDAGANADGYTGYDIMDSSAWYTVTMNVTGLTNIWLAFWDGANEGSVLIKNVSFSGDNRPDADYVLTKTAGKSCNNYGDNAFWIKKTGDFDTLTFKMKSDDFNYVQLTKGEGGLYGDWNDFTSQAIIVIKDASNNTVTCTESNWTGEVLTTGEWYTFTLDVSNVYDVGLVWWSSQAGTVLIKDIAFS